MIIGIHGVAQSGKDTVFEYLKARHNFKRFAFADKVRESALAIDPLVVINMKSLYLTAVNLINYQNQFFDISNDYAYIRLQTLVGIMGWDEAKKLPEVRRLLQVIGTDAGRNIHGKDCWLKFFDTDPTIDLESDDYCVTDIRFDDEAEKLKGCDVVTPVVIIHLIRGEAVNDHVSESGISSHLIDVPVENNGTLNELYWKIEHILDEARKGKYEDIRTARNQSN